MALSASQIDAHFAKWVRAENKAGRKLTEVGAIKPEQFGTAAAPIFFFKAGETNALLELLLFILKGKAAQLGADGATIFETGEHLFTPLQLIRRFPKGMPTPNIQAFHISAKG